MCVRACVRVRAYVLCILHMRVPATHFGGTTSSSSSSSGTTRRPSTGQRSASRTTSPCSTSLPRSPSTSWRWWTRRPNFPRVRCPCLACIVRVWRASVASLGSRRGLPCTAVPLSLVLHCCPASCMCCTVGALSRVLPCNVILPAACALLHGCFIVTCAALRCCVCPQ